MYENRLLRAYTQSEVNQNLIEDLIQAYTQARMKDAMLKADFAKQMRSVNGHIFEKVLRETIVDELKLTEAPS